MKFILLFRKTHAFFTHFHIHNHALWICTNICFDFAKKYICFQLIICISSRLISILVDGHQILTQRTLPEKKKKKMFGSCKRNELMFHKNVILLDLLWETKCIKSIYSYWRLYELRMKFQNFLYVELSIYLSIYLYVYIYIKTQSDMLLQYHLKISVEKIFMLDFKNCFPKIV